jgi:hypothetical protein
MGHRIDIWINNATRVLVGLPPLHFTFSHKAIHCSHLHHEGSPNAVTLATLGTRAALRAFSIQNFAKNDSPCKIFNVLPTCGGKTTWCGLECSLAREMIVALGNRVTREEQNNPKQSVCHTIELGVVAARDLFPNGKKYSE